MFFDKKPNPPEKKCIFFIGKSLLSLPTKMLLGVIFRFHLPLLSTKFLGHDIASELLEPCINSTSGFCLDERVAPKQLVPQTNGATCPPTTSFYQLWRGEKEKNIEDDLDDACGRDSRVSVQNKLRNLRYTLTLQRYRNVRDSYSHRLCNKYGHSRYCI